MKKRNGKNKMGASLFVSFVVLAFGGMINSGYLVWKHHQKQPLVCPLNHDCSVVTESKWSHIFYFRNETLGFLFFLSMLVAAFATLFVPSLTILPTLILLGMTGALLFSTLLVGLQFLVIKDYCFYCLISAIVTALLFLNGLALF